MNKKITTLEGFNRNITVNLKQIHSDPLIKMKKYDGCATNLGASIDKNGLPVTGLTEDYEIPASKPGAIPKKVQGTRKAMEALLDLPEGTLKQTSPYWGKYYIKISSDPIELVLSENHDLLKYLFAIAQTNVADGLSKINESSALEYVLFSAEQVATDKIESRTAYKEAIMLADKLDLKTKMEILAVYGEVTDATAPNIIINKLDEKIEENPKNFLKIANDSRLIIRSLLTHVLDKGILTTKDGAYYHGDVVVGYTEDMAVEAIDKDMTLQTILKAKLSGDMEVIAAALAKVKTEPVTETK